MTEFVPCSEIKFTRDDRQRKIITTDDLEASIARHGVLVPIIIDDDNNLIAGERRLTTSLKLGLPTIPVRRLSSLSSAEAQIVELIENFNRLDLTWQESVLAMDRIHTLFCESNPDWTFNDSERETGFAHSTIRRYVKIARAMEEDERIAKFDSVNTARNYLARKEERKKADALASITDMSIGMFDLDSTPTPSPESLDAQSPSEHDRIVSPRPAHIERAPAVIPPSQRPLHAPPARESIINGDFISWANDYSGPAFNFIHCDFPYGVNLFAGKWSGRSTHVTYDDESSTYWKLCDALFANLDRLMGHSGHIMFWFSMEYYTETLKLFAERAPSLTMQRLPLVWFKTDNTGVASDPRRRPRNVTEFALIGSREDRPIIRPVANAYGGPTDKKLHTSTKPEPMLRHFFQMFVDESTRMLDPTCGSGAALRAAESLGAEHVFGLELNPEIAEGAQGALKDFRALRKLSAK